jgi:hypothetical protein
VATQLKELAVPPSEARAAGPSDPSPQGVSAIGGIPTAGALLAKLREPFPERQISKLPKESRAQIDERKARKQGCMVWNCAVCGGSHHKDAVHLDYVGHAALTDRLLDADIEWNWEPMAFTPEGLPAFDRNGGLWIRLTVQGVTRPGYGSADGKSGGDAVKEIIGDALRNAAMRFGAALDLWHKGDLHGEDEGQPEGSTQGQSQTGAVSPDAPAKRPPQHSALKTKLRGFVHELNGCGDGDELSAFLATSDAIKTINETREKLPHLWDGNDWPDGVERPEEFVPLCDLISRRQRECAEATAQYLTA